MNKVRIILDQWPDRRAIALDLGKPYPTVSGWYNRASIPAWHWGDLIAAAERRGLAGVTLADIAAAHNSEREGRAA